MNVQMKILVTDPAQDIKKVLRFAPPLPASPVELTAWLLRQFDPSGAVSERTHELVLLSGEELREGGVLTHSSQIQNGQRLRIRLRSNRTSASEERVQGVDEQPQQKDADDGLAAKAPRLEQQQQQEEPKLYETAPLQVAMPVPQPSKHQQHPLLQHQSTACNNTSVPQELQTSPFSPDCVIPDQQQQEPSKPPVVPARQLNIQNLLAKKAPRPPVLSAPPTSSEMDTNSQAVANKLLEDIVNAPQDLSRITDVDKRSFSFLAFPKLKVNFSHTSKPMQRIIFRELLQILQGVAGGAPIRTMPTEGGVAKHLKSRLISLRKSGILYGSLPEGPQVLYEAWVRGVITIHPKCKTPDQVATVDHMGVQRTLSKIQKSQRRAIKNLSARLIIAFPYAKDAEFLLGPAKRAALKSTNFNAHPPVLQAKSDDDNGKKVAPAAVGLERPDDADSVEVVKDEIKPEDGTAKPPTTKRFGRAPAAIMDAPPSTSAFVKKAPADLTTPAQTPHNGATNATRGSSEGDEQKAIEQNRSDNRSGENENNAPRTGAFNKVPCGSSVFGTSRGVIKAPASSAFRKGVAQTSQGNTNQSNAVQRPAQSPTFAGLSKPPQHSAFRKAPSNDGVHINCPQSEDSAKVPGAALVFTTKAAPAPKVGSLAWRESFSWKNGGDGNAAPPPPVNREPVLDAAVGGGMVVSDHDTTPPQPAPHCETLHSHGGEEDDSSSADSCDEEEEEEEEESVGDDADEPGINNKKKGATDDGGNSNLEAARNHDTKDGNDTSVASCGSVKGCRSNSAMSSLSSEDSDDDEDDGVHSDDGGSPRAVSEEGSDGEDDIMEFQ